MAAGETGPHFPEGDEPTKLQGDELGAAALGGFRTDTERAYKAGYKGGSPTNAELPEEEHEGDQTAE